MSLDVYLTMPGYKSESGGSGIFVREGGSTKEISRAEWDDKFPDREPIVISRRDDEEVFTYNITHNLHKMAKEAGIGQHLWSPEELEITKGSELIAPLQVGLDLLRSDPKRFEKFNPANGWGTYGGLVNFVSEYLVACRMFPDAVVSVSR